MTVKINFHHNYVCLNSSSSQTSSWAITHRWFVMQSAASLRWLSIYKFLLWACTVPSRKVWWQWLLWLLGSKWNSDAQLLALHSRSSHVLTSFHCALCFNLHLSYRFTRLHFLWQWITKKRKLSSVSEELFLQRWLSFLNFCDYLNLSLRLSKYCPTPFSSVPHNNTTSKAGEVLMA